MPVLISLSPNTETDDVLLALRKLLTPWTWKNNADADAVTQNLSRLFRGRPATLTASGRGALYHSLKALGIGAGDEVIIQAFTCIAVPASVSWTGAKPIYVDLEPGTYNIDPAQVAKNITPRTKALIIQHTFGIPARLTALVSIAKKHNLLLIEDCAHAIGSTYHNQPLGTFGDVTILSFGRDKSLSSIFGGAVLAAADATHHKITAEISRLNPPPPSWIVQQLLHPIIMFLVKPLYYRLALGKILLITAQNIGLISKAVLPGERKSLPPPHADYAPAAPLISLLKKQLTKLELFNQRRRDIAHWYDRELAINLPRPVPPPNSDPAWLRYPLQMDHPDQLITNARAKNLMLGDWYNNVLAPRGSNLAAFHYQPGSCPEAEKTAAHVINLPTYPTIEVKEVKSVIKFINESVVAHPPDKGNKGGFRSLKK